jgi:hypothetical protein
VALVAGEAGIGKTRLVQELVRRVPAGTLVLAGQADPGTVGRPMELFLDATAPAVTAPAGAPGREDGAGDAGRPGRGGGEHDGDGGPDGLLAVVRDADRPADERVRAGVGLVRRLARDRTALVVFEDLHWADSESVAVFERLAEPAPAARTTRPASCWWAPTGPTGCRAAIPPPRRCPASSGATRSRTSTSIG